MSNPIKAGLVTSAFVFVGTFLLLALGWIADVGAWASSQGASAFPDWSVLGYGLVSALVAAVTGFINWAVRALQDAGALPGSAPQYGAVDTTGTPRL